MANVPSLSVVRDPAKPKKLGRYELEDCLGSEGGRETYRARVRGLAGFDRIFAVKCLRRRPGVVVSRNDPFLAAAKRIGSVLDARVARVLDADVMDGVAVAVTEFVHGLDLDRFREWAQVSGELATGSEPAAEKWQKYVAYIGAEIAGALAAMHALAPPFVHGGLSPRNVIITERGGIKLLDAGLALASQKGGDAFSQRALAYAAPALSGTDPTPASDIRALGAMLFELAVGELPPPGVTSTAARKVLEVNWPSMAEFIASMLAEDSALRPRAAAAFDVLAGRYGGSADAAMLSEMAALVRNFSAFVADSSPPVGTAAPDAEPAVADRFPSGASGILSVAPPSPPAASLVSVAPPAPVAPLPSTASGSFFATSDQETRVSPDGNYASAIFGALPPEAPAGSAPRESPARATPPPPQLAIGPAGLRNPTIHAFGQNKVSDLPAAKPAADPAAPQSRQAPLPVLAAGPLAKGGALPSLPPAPVVPAPPAPPVAALRGRTLVMSPSSPAPSSAKPAIPASPARTLFAPAGPPVPSPPPPAVPSPPPLSRPPSSAKLASLEAVEEVEPEPLVEAADWGAQALRALGTQAGVPISLIPDAAADGSGAVSLAEAPPLVNDPGIDEAFAFAPHPPPPADNWVGPPPVSQGTGPNPIQAASIAAPSPPRQELLEEEVLEDEPTPLLVTGGGGELAAGWGGEGAEAGELQLAEPLEPMAAVSESRPVLEATAFLTEEESAPAPEPEPIRVSQALPAPEDGGGRRPRTQNALRSPGNWAEAGADALDGELLPPTRSRARKIAAVLFIAAGLGAGAAALMLNLTGKKGAPPPGIGQPRLQQATAVKVTKQAAAPGEGEVALAPKERAPTKSALGPKAAAAGKAAPPALLGKSKPGKAQPELPAAAKVKPTPAAGAEATAAKAAPGPRLAAAPVKAQEGTASQPVPAVAGATAPGPLGAALRVPFASQPAGARVWVNGQERGETPCHVQLPPGPATVVLVHPGYLTSQSTLEVREGAKVDETLKPVEPPMTGEARFRAECQTTGKLPIVVDGKETGILCPFSKMRVEPGTHTIGLLIPATGKVHQKEVILFAGVRSVVFRD
jgi:hypothetical protein